MVDEVQQDNYTCGMFLIVPSNKFCFDGLLGSRRTVKGNTFMFSAVQVFHENELNLELT